MSSSALPSIQSITSSKTLKMLLELTILDLNELSGLVRNLNLDQLCVYSALANYELPTIYKNKFIDLCSMQLINGVVQSGNGPEAMIISNALVYIYKTTASDPVIIATTTTNSIGRFNALIPSNLDENIIYVVAHKNKNIVLATILGNKVPISFVINEITTVGAAYSMAQFFIKEAIRGNALGILIGSYMNDNLVNITTGELSSVITSSPNADQTNTMRSINSLSNLIVQCVRNDYLKCEHILNYTAPTEETRSSNTLQALLNIAHFPVNDHIFERSLEANIYTPILQRSPEAWTLAVKFDQTGSEDCPFGGPGNFAFDKRGYIWITNNVIQGTPNSADCIVVLQPNGKPSDGSNNSPVSPIFGGGILGTGYGIAIDKDGSSVWVGNYGWGESLPNNGSVSQFSLTGKAISGIDGYISYLYRPQGMDLDQDNNLWIASNGNDRIVVFLNSDPDKALYFQEPSGSAPFGVAISKDGSCWVTNTGNSSVPSSVSKFAISSENTIVELLNLPIGKSLLDIAIDAKDNVWVASSLDSNIYQIDSNGALLNIINDTSISNPWGVTVDGDDNIWIANFGQDNSSDPKQYVVTELCGSSLHCPSGYNTGNIISPQGGYNLPNAGSQILLGDGTPLYGVNGLKSFEPFMRATKVVIDAAGNIFVANNWKPSFVNDVLNNPGGDGIVVFIGLAAPIEQE